MTIHILEINSFSYIAILIYKILTTEFSRNVLFD